MIYWVVNLTDIINLNRQRGVSVQCFQATVASILLESLSINISGSGGIKTISVKVISPNEFGKIIDNFQKVINDRYKYDRHFGSRSLWSRKIKKSVFCFEKCTPKEQEKTGGVKRLERSTI